MAKHDHTGRTKAGEPHGTYVPRELLEEPAFRALSPKAQILYIWLRLSWGGPNSTTYKTQNGHIFLSVRQAAEKIGMSRRTLHRKLHTYNLHDL